MMFMSVDLPEPEGPTMATNSPSSTRRLTPRSASTTTLPRWYTRHRSRMSMRVRGEGRTAGAGAGPQVPAGGPASTGRSMRAVIGWTHHCA